MTGRLWADNTIVGPFSKLLQIIDFCSVPRSIFLARDLLCFRDHLGDFFFFFLGTDLIFG